MGYFSEMSLDMQESRKPSADPLTRENDEGYWYGCVDGAVAGQQYKFVLTNGDLRLERIDPYARQVTNSVGNGVIVDPADFDWQGDDFTLPPLNELVIYEAHVGSFVTQPGRQGNLELLTDKLQHVVNLGCNVIQLMPVAEFAGDLSWGYNPAHMFAVESTYGGPHAYREFVRRAHIGDFLKRPTLPFNGYADDVASLYSGIDLRANY